MPVQFTCETCGVVFRRPPSRGSRFCCNACKYAGPSLAERFWPHVAVAGPDECWLWQSTLMTTGYGLMRVRGKHLGAHRVSFFIHHGHWPEPFGLHSCDVRRCVNPAHLFEGTQADNVADMIAKGRQVIGPRAGEHNGRARLTAALVAEIRARYAAGGVSQLQLARDYEVAGSTVWQIVHGKKWMV